MATLYKYKESSDRGDGYFVRLKPEDFITLQTYEITDELYDELDKTAKPLPEGGDKIPNRFVWALYNAGLHYTKGEDNDLDKESILETIEGDTVSLSENEREKIREFIERKDDSRLREVGEELDIEVDEAERSTEVDEEDKEITTVDPAMVNLGYNLPDTVEDAVTDWGIYRPADECLKIIDKNKRAQESVRQMRQHPWEVDSIEVSESSIEYHVPHTCVEQLSFFDHNFVGLIVHDYLQPSSDESSDETLASTSVEDMASKSFGHADYVIQLKHQRRDSALLILNDGNIIGSTDIITEDDEEEEDAEMLEIMNHIANSWTTVLSLTCAEFAKKSDEYELNTGAVEELAFDLSERVVTGD